MQSYTDQETSAIVTEEMIERAVESKINSLDRKFMSSDMSQDDYDAKMSEIRKWADAQYERLDGSLNQEQWNARYSTEGEMPYGC